jgi:hypothetical protein
VAADVVITVAFQSPLAAPTPIPTLLEALRATGKELLLLDSTPPLQALPVLQLVPGVSNLMIGQGCNGYPQLVGAADWSLMAMREYKSGVDSVAFYHGFASLRSFETQEQYWEFIVEKVS